MNPHRGSDFNEFMIEENLMTQEPQTYRSEYEQAFQRGREHGAYRIAELERELAAERALADRLVKSAQALVDRWETPFWKDAPHTAKFIRALDDALAAWKEARSGTV